LYFKAIEITAKTFKICIINTGSTDVEDVAIRWWALPAQGIPQIKVDKPVLVPDEPLSVSILLDEGMEITKIVAKTPDDEIEIESTVPEEIEVVMTPVTEIVGEATNEIVLPISDDVMTLEFTILEEGVSHVIKKEIMRKAVGNG
jgi:hypothetical protein